MRRASLAYCAAALLVALAVAALGFPLAALSPETLAAARQPTAAETLPDVDLGEDFGTVSVIELVGYYIENPPAPAAEGGQAAAAMQRFGGC